MVSSPELAIAAATTCALCGCGRLLFEPPSPLADSGLDAAPPPPDAGGADAPGATDGAVDGRGAFDGSADAAWLDARAEGDAARDAGEDGAAPRATCLDWTIPFRFGGLEPVAEINTVADERGVRISSDGLTVSFQSDRAGGAGGADIYVGTRMGTAEVFSGFAQLDGVNTADAESSAHLRADGLEVIVSSDRPGGAGAADLWQLTRTGTAEPFGGAVSLDNVNSTLNEWDPFLFDAFTLFYSGRTGGALGSELFMSTRPSAVAPFAPPTMLGELGSDGGEGNPSLTQDGRVIVFNSSRAGGAGGSDLWYATRADAESPWAAPLPVPGVNTAAGENDPFVDASGCTLYFATGSPADVYRAHFMPL